MKDYRKIAERFAKGLKEKYGKRIERIVLFGSVARGEYDEDSDIDLLVVTRGDRLGLQAEVCKDAVEALLRHGAVLSPLVLSWEEAERLGGTGFGREVASEGLLIA